MDAISWTLLYHMFCDIEPDAEKWSAAAFTHNGERFERHGPGQKVFERVAAYRGYEAGEFLSTVEEDLSVTQHAPISTDRVTSQ